MLLLLLWLGVHIAVFLCGGEKRSPSVRNFAKTFTIALIGLDAIVIGVIVLLFVLFERRWYLQLLSVPAGALLVWLLADLLLRRLRGKRLIVWLVCALLVGGTIGGIYGYQNYLERITLREEFDYRTYMPFRADSPVSRLEEPATLRFSEGDKLPRMDGATALFPVYAAFCQAVYPESLAEGEKPGLREVLSCSTTTGAYKAIVDGDSDIIFAGGPSQAQEDYAAREGVELVYTPIGREAFVFFVHPDNPIQSLSPAQLRDIYSGKITRWDQLGVEGLGEILAYQRDEGSGSQTALQRWIMGDTPLVQPATEEVETSMGGIVKRVSAYQNHRNAIGFSFRFYCTALMKGFDVKLLEIEGVAPTVENIENGSYPLAGSFYAVTRSDADENTLALLDWIRGEQGQALVEKSGYTPAE